MDNKAKILDIAMNLNRIGNWVADGYQRKQKRITIFLGNTRKYIELLDINSFSKPFKNTLLRFLTEYNDLENEGFNGPKDELLFAEKMMTWGNILTHRANLIKT